MKKLLSVLLILALCALGLEALRRRRVKGGM